MCAWERRDEGQRLAHAACTRYLAAPLGSRPSRRSDIHLPESSSSSLSDCPLDPCPTTAPNASLLPGVLLLSRLAADCCRGSSQAAKLPSPPARPTPGLAPSCLCEEVVAHALSVSRTGRFLRLLLLLAAATAFGGGTGWSHEPSDSVLLPPSDELSASVTLWRAAPPVASWQSLVRSTVPYSEVSSGGWVPA